MQIDMHYFGTYAMAVAAGLRADVGKAVATASQYVDDNAVSKSVRLADGGCIDVVATAHTTKQIQNLDEDDQRLVWVPFHFLPGNRGPDLLSRLTCAMDSEVAHEAVRHSLSQSDAPFAMELIGVTAHAYADTFSHYGFSGVSAHLNRVHAESITLDDDLDPEIRAYITEKAARFLGGKLGSLLSRFDALKGAAAEQLSGALGHGGVATYPDRPYLRWGFTYETDGETVQRDNPMTFRAGCRALHALFRAFAEARPDLAASSGKDFDAIEDRVAAILATQEKKDGRSRAWSAAVQDGAFGPARGGIPPYDGEAWTALIDGMAGRSSAGLDNTPAYRFHQAAELHRTHVVRVLLPSIGIHVA